MQLLTKAVRNRSLDIQNLVMHTAPVVVEKGAAMAVDIEMVVAGAGAEVGVEVEAEGGPIARLLQHQKPLLDPSWMKMASNSFRISGADSLTLP